jgi:acyl-CoA reductase-like NAD-dependent aldehyde dehydrogenase
LESLHNGLHKKVSAICAAITIDTQNTNTEVVAEFFMAMTAIKYFHDSLNFEKELKDEYSTVAGNNYDTRRTSVGLVLVRPTYHTRFYSILSPAAAAIAAGNCVVIEASSLLFAAEKSLIYCPAREQYP